VVGVAVVSSHLEKTHAKLKEMGYTYAKVEYFNPWSKTTLDLFGLHDTVAIRGDKPGVWGINSCGEDVSTHINKYLRGYWKPATPSKPAKLFGPNECLLPWLKAGNRFSLFGWVKRGAKGKRKLWTLRNIEFFVVGDRVEFKELEEESSELETGGI
jgi:hypothetical protein